MYSTWTVPQLKAELRARGATLRGRKADLVSRLEAYDRNFNFGIPQSPSAETEDAKIELPEHDLYHDINSSMILPPITKQHIRYYFDQFNKKPDGGLQLYESRFLVVVRAAAATVAEYTFVKAVGKASMKRLQYEINIKIHASGNIEETACECVAGSGTTAHCKHVAMALYAVEHMVREKILIKYQTPTETLQKFHKPKGLFTSTPLKSSSLPMKRNIDNVIFSPCKMEVDKAEYNKKFRSLVVNFTSSTMPFKQLYEPANPHGIELDHNYCEDNVESVLRNMNLVTISPQIVTAIELETRGQAKNQKWFSHRQHRITAGKFHTICHLKSETQKKYAEQMLEPQSFTSRATNHGIVNEAVALQQYRETYGLDVEDCGFFVSINRPFLGASPDGLLGEETVIEVKCPYATRNEKISPTTVPYLVIGEGGNFEFKKGCPYFYQVQGQFYCTGRKYANLIIYTFKDMQVIYVQRDDEFIEEMLCKLDRFYNNHFKEALLNKFVYKNYSEIIKTVHN